MRLTSSYGMKLKGDFKALETSIELYRKALRMLIPIINDGWDLIGEYRYVNQKYNLIEKWIHNTRTNRARFDFDEQFPKFPTYLRRSAIAKALGIVSSYRSNLENWEREGKGQTPKLSLTHFTYPAYYKGNLLELRLEPYGEIRKSIIGKKLKPQNLMIEALSKRSLGGEASLSTL